MWPEGAVVRTRSRRDSQTSRSSRVSGGPKVPPLNPEYASSKASTTRNSRYAPVRARFWDDEGPERQDVRSFNMSSIRAAVSPQYSPSPDDAINRNGGPSRPAPRMREPERDEEEEEIERVDTRVRPTRSSNGASRRDPRLLPVKPSFIGIYARRKWYYI